MKNNKIILRLDDSVGIYEDISLLICDNCEYKEIALLKIDSSEDNWLKEKSQDYEEDWECPNCYRKPLNPSVLLGTKFICPACKKENIVIREPNEIKQEDDIKHMAFIQNIDDTIICNFCENEFYTTLVIEFENQINKPETWKKLLFKKEE